jgi:hypothetical protein
MRSGDGDFDIPAVQLEKERKEGQARFFLLSSNRRQVIVHSGHNMNLEAPEEVTSAIHEVVNAVRDHRRLTGTLRTSMACRSRAMGARSSEAEATEADGRSEEAVPGTQRGGPGGVSAGAGPARFIPPGRSAASACPGVRRAHRVAARAGYATDDVHDMLERSFNEPEKKE